VYLRHEILEMLETANSWDGSMGVRQEAADCCGESLDPRHEAVEMALVHWLLDLAVRMVLDGTGTSSSSPPTAHKHL
jgi:hypothetical protein